MTELLFPGGVVRIDEGHVWAELAKWSKVSTSEKSRNVHMRFIGGRYEVELVETTGHALHHHWTGRSALSLGDAAAQALQTAANAEAA
jgi:hypothetical protein